MDRLSSVQTYKALRLNIVAGCLGSAHFMMVGGVALTGYALLLGANEFQLGIMGAIPLLMGPAQLVSSIITEKLRKRKLLFMTASGIGRSMWLLMLPLPWLIPDTAPKALNLYLFLTFYSLSHLGQALAVPTWLSWISDIIPGDQGGRFWGKRTRFTNSTSLIITLCYGYFLNLFDKSNALGFSIVFLFATCLGELDIMLHRWMPDVPMAGKKSRGKPFELLKRPVKDPNFRNFLMFNIMWYLGVFMQIPFVHWYYLEKLNLSFLHITFCSAVYLVPKAAFAQIWGIIIDKFGCKPVTAICVAAKVLFPLALIIVFPFKAYALFILIPIYLYIGFIDAGMETAMNPMLLNVSPQEGRSMFVASYHSVIGVIAAIAPLVAGHYIHDPESSELFRFGGETILGGTVFLKIHAVFVLSALARLGSLFWLKRVKEPKSHPTAFVLRQFGAANLFSVARLLQSVTGSTSEERRIRALRSLASYRSPMATEELIDALDDNSLMVRKEAALALGRAGQSEAFPALAEKLKDPDSGIQAAAAEALGLLGDSRAVDVLLDSLPTNDRELLERISQALATIGDSRAFPPLLKEFKDAQDSRAMANTARALAALGEVQAIRHIFPRIRETELPLLRRELGITVANILGDEGVFYRILNREMQVSGLGVDYVVSQLRKACAKRRNDPCGKPIFDILSSIEDMYSDKRFDEVQDAVLRICLAKYALFENGEQVESNTLEKNRLKLSGILEDMSVHDPASGACLYYIYLATAREMKAEHFPSRVEILLLLYAMMHLFRRDTKSRK
ncbi:MFS transporter [Candidatus Hydrogenedentota bacterium]